MPSLDSNPYFQLVWRVRLNSAYLKLNGHCSTTDFVTLIFSPDGIRRENHWNDFLVVIKLIRNNNGLDSQWNFQSDLIVFHWQFSVRWSCSWYQFSSSFDRDITDDSRTTPNCLPRLPVPRNWQTCQERYFWPAVRLPSTDDCCREARLTKVNAWRVAQSNSVNRPISRKISSFCYSPPIHGRARNLLN